MAIQDGGGYSLYLVFTTNDEFVALQRSLSCVQSKHGEGGSTDWLAEHRSAVVFDELWYRLCAQVRPEGAFYNNCLENIGLPTGFRSVTFGSTLPFFTVPRELYALSILKCI